MLNYQRVFAWWHWDTKERNILWDGVTKHRTFGSFWTSNLRCYLKTFLSTHQFFLKNHSMPSLNANIPDPVSCCFHCSMPLANAMVVILNTSQLGMTSETYNEATAKHVFFPWKDERKEVTVLLKSCGFLGVAHCPPFGNSKTSNFFGFSQYPRKGLQQLAVSPSWLWVRLLSTPNFHHFANDQTLQVTGWTLASIFSHWEALSISPQVNILHLNDYLTIIHLHTNVVTPMPSHFLLEGHHPPVSDSRPFAPRKWTATAGLEGGRRGGLPWKFPGFHWGSKSPIFTHSRNTHLSGEYTPLCFAKVFLHPRRMVVCKWKNLDQPRYIM